jgi:hypothetical protein
VRRVAGAPWTLPELSESATMDSRTSGFFIPTLEILEQGPFFAARKKTFVSIKRDGNNARGNAGADVHLSVKLSQKVST